MALLHSGNGAAARRGGDPAAASSAAVALAATRQAQLSGAGGPAAASRVNADTAGMSAADYARSQGHQPHGARAPSVALAAAAAGGTTFGGAAAAGARAQLQQGAAYVPVLRGETSGALTSTLNPNNPNPAVASLLAMTRPKAVPHHQQSKEQARAITDATAALQSMVATVQQLLQQQQLQQQQQQQPQQQTFQLSSLAGPASGQTQHFGAASSLAPRSSGAVVRGGFSRRPAHPSPGSRSGAASVHVPHQRLSLRSPIFLTSTLSSMPCPWPQMIDLAAEEEEEEERQRTAMRRRHRREDQEEVVDLTEEQEDIIELL